MVLCIRMQNYLLKNHKKESEDVLWGEKHQKDERLKMERSNCVTQQRGGSEGIFSIILYKNVSKREDGNHNKQERIRTQT